MRRYSVMKRAWVAVVVLMMAALILGGCGKSGSGGDKPGSGATATKPSPPSTPGPAAAAAAAPEPGGGETPEPPAATETPTPPAATEAPAASGGASARTAVNREVLAKAYEEIYCAQKLGRTDEILDLYKKFGFDTPGAWTEAWRSTSEDPEWQAALTKRVQASRCE